MAPVDAAIFVAMGATIFVAMVRVQLNQKPGSGLAAALTSQAAAVLEPSGAGGNPVIGGRRCPITHLLLPLLAAQASAGPGYLSLGQPSVAGQPPSEVCLHLRPALDGRGAEGTGRHHLVAVGATIFEGVMVYGFIEKNGRSFCVLYTETVVSRTWNINRHFETNHSQLLEKSEDERKEYISRQLHLYKSQSNSILKFTKGSTNLTSASLSIAHSIAQHGKALSEGEFIKETLLTCAPVLFHDMQNKDAIIKRISELPLSRNIIKDRIMRLNTNVQHQLKRDIRKCKYFSISLDETTDVTSHAQLAIIGRYSDGLTMREELIKLVSVSTSKSGSEICKVVIQTFRDLSIDISKVVSVMTDGAPHMVGEKVGFVKLFTEAIGHPIMPFHCIIHQEACMCQGRIHQLKRLNGVCAEHDRHQPWWDGGADEWGRQTKVELQLLSSGQASGGY
ncbi:hypothetical protein QTO34_019715 [Cnephaeus nilssonii]|uniref:DUF4371 domain-containing protein n=1 Tax=Cnephaeus nilssonii TaxID=3371016 RepID=A0AA40HY78_CNENI|nr:hypothetical protein QTO34_019715 [Eptesicus nilssonii]